MQPSPELVELTQRIYDSLLADPDAMRELFLASPDTVALGTDDREWWVGHDNIAAIFERQMAEIGTGWRWCGTSPLAFRHGEVGWSVDRVVFTPPEGMAFTLRITMVFILERAHWKIAHWHASSGTANEELLGIELPLGIDAVAAAVEEERPNMGPATAGDGTVTLMFSDIEGSTAILDSLGDLRYHRLLEWHHGLVARTLAEHDGHEVSRQGDGFMLAFSSARRAIRCALSLQHRLAEGPGDDLPGVRVRMGIHTGEVLRDKDAFFGRTVHFAARVASAAGGTEVLVSDLVRSLVEGTEDIVFPETRQIEMKGFDGHHQVHMVASA
ncbi:MAG TPA: adenylate/guanylate cyclase domain-containing protein [Acidimicrobiales bacterium]|nr:adenylate/guanylate cyclase domain-containing protein [Acidimicrobiales bacterium]